MDAAAVVADDATAPAPSGGAWALDTPWAVEALAAAAPVDLVAVAASAVSEAEASAEAERRAPGKPRGLRIKQTTPLACGQGGGLFLVYLALNST